MTTSTSALPALPVNTDTRSITERFNAMLRNLYNKILPVGAASTVLTSDGTTFSWAAPPAGAITNTGTTTFLAADVALNNVANFFDGPNTGSIGANGQTWQITAVGTVVCPGAAATGEIAIFNGSAYVAASAGVAPAAGFPVIVTITAAVVLTGAATFTLRAKSNQATSVLNTTGAATAIANKATSITAVRLA